MTPRSRVAAVVLTAALAAVACTTNRGATQPPTTTTHGGSAAPPARDLRGLIAYGTQAGDIWVMDADGSDQRQLTHTADGEGPVAWLPDGRIVYSSFHGNRPVPDWYLMNLDGTGVRSLPQLRGAGDPIDWLAPVR
jgi:Tol biopolymer transport system component